ncbi:D-arabinitol dehydrogenase 1 [Sphaceloma murrayae]|uniref:D-arabinitol dehydrogenase 1 n=1 Tax=Sphaceloma murrayae TaxID=2082308 RepID=A0A2K1QZ42_9PEZI|nr:D-arabinitol dehydrogenase 1 [Sphaceloma murrayae]
MADNATQPLSFVTATKLEQFKAPSVMQRVRKTVMRDYLSKQSTGGRTIEAGRPTRIDARAASTLPPILPKPVPTSRRDSHLPLELGVININTGRIPILSDAPEDFHKRASPDSIDAVIAPATHRESLFVLEPGSIEVAKRVGCLVAYIRNQDETNRKASPDPFTTCEPIPTTVDLDLLKINCATYFGSYGLAEQWLPLMLSSPQAFLASLCISAPYTDLMTVHRQGAQLASYTNTRQTMEILDVVPRMINDSINKHGSSDGNIVSVAQLLMGQLSTPYTALIGSHQSALRQMVNARGGFANLDGNGVLSMNIALINIEANILRGEAADPMYLEFVELYLTQNTNLAEPSPEGPLHWLGPDMRRLAASTLCRPETLRMVVLMQELTVKVIRLHELEEREMGDILIAKDHALEKARLNDKIWNLILRTHEMPGAVDLHTDSASDWIYETVRLTSLLFCHAVWHRKPLHADLQCSLGCRQIITPEKIQEAVLRTPIRTAWGLLTGVMYWVLMIGAAACHDPDGEVVNLKTPEIDILSASTSPGARHADNQRRTGGATSQHASQRSDITATSIMRGNQQPSPDPIYPMEAAAQTFVAGKRLYHQYAQKGDVCGLMSPEEDTNDPFEYRISRPALPRSASDHGTTPLFLRDSGFVYNVDQDDGKSLDGSKRRRRDDHVSQEAAGKRRQMEMRGYIKRYLTANAIRDLHYHKGEFMAKFPLIPGHEAAGTIVAVGTNVKGLSIGDRVAADPMQPCSACYYCHRAQPLMCEQLVGYGGNVPGGFAEYCRYHAKLVHKIGHLPALEAILIEPTACATHGIERMMPKVGSSALLFGCGPTGLLLAQLLRLNGVAHLTIASKAGPKLDLAKKMGIADTFVCISDTDPQADMNNILKQNPHGFDLVIEATGAASVLEQAIFFVRKSGTLVVYGVYDDHVKIAWPPSRIWTYEITILASFCSTLKFPAVLEYLRTGKLKLGGIVTDTYRIEQWEECLEAVRTQSVVKAAIVFD